MLCAGLFGFVSYTVKCMVLDQPGATKSILHWAWDLVMTMRLYYPYFRNVPAYFAIPTLFASWHFEKTKKYCALPKLFYKMNSADHYLMETVHVNKYVVPWGAPACRSRSVRLRARLHTVSPANPAKAPPGGILMLHTTNQEWLNPLRLPLDRDRSLGKNGG